MGGDYTGSGEAMVKYVTSNYQLQGIQQILKKGGGGGGISLKR